MSLIASWRATAALSVATLAATAFAAGTPVEPLSGSRVDFDGGLTLDLDTTRHISLTLHAPTTIDVRAQSRNALAVMSDVGSAGPGTVGFVLIRSDTGEVTAAVLTSPLRRHGVDAAPILFGRGAEAGSQLSEIEKSVDGTCGLCRLEAGDYELLGVAMSGTTTVAVHIGEDATPRSLDIATLRDVSSIWHGFQGGIDTDDLPPRETSGPAVMREASSLLYCHGCTLPVMFVVHHGVTELRDSAGVLTACTGEEPFAEDECTRQAVAEEGVLDTQPWLHTIQTAPAENRVGGTARVDAAGLKPDIRIRLGTLFLPLPLGDVNSPNGGGSTGDLRLVTLYEA